MIELSLIVPCFNEEGNVVAFFEETEKVFSSSGIEYEYVFVNDGSKDNTWSELRKIISDNPFSSIKAISFSRNFGKESAIYAGLKNADGEYSCIIDADLQQRPETAYKMLEIIKNSENVDCVCAFQRVRKEGKLLSFLKSAFYKVINKMAETEFKNGASDFRVFNSKVKNAILSLGEYHRFSKGIFSWVGFNTEYMEYEACERNSGTSKWNPIKLFKYAFSGIVAFSTAPLSVSTYIGGMAIVISVIYFIVTIIRKFTNHISVDGFTQLALLVTFFSGVLLLTVGIIGQYIAKIYQQIKNRPIFIIDEIISTKENK